LNRLSKDCESDRKWPSLGLAKDAKRFWNYNTLFRGVRILVAYEGTLPVGHLEYIPIEHAPKPVTGANLTFIDCMFVEPKQRWHGVGSELLRACEEKNHDRPRPPVIAYRFAVRPPVFSEPARVRGRASRRCPAMFKAWRRVCRNSSRATTTRSISLARRRSMCSGTASARSG
jgi:GNAT superfamily N-acetyltransferase